jgi:hypothetical protein
MKKRVYIIILVTLVGLSNVFSQINLKPGFNIGGQVSSLRGLEYETENNFDLVPFVGLNLEVSVSSSISVITGINFERWKKKVEIYNFGPYGNTMGKYTVKEGYDFYNIPLLIRYKFGNKKQLFIDSGAFVNYFNKAKPNGFMPLFISFEDYNFGAALGVGIKFYLSDLLDLNIQLRNDLGFTDVNKYKTMLSGNVKTNTIRLIATFDVKM